MRPRDAAEGCVQEEKERGEKKGLCANVHSSKLRKGMAVLHMGKVEEGREVKLRARGGYGEGESGEGR